MEIMKNKKIKQLIKKLYENGELDKIINMEESNDKKNMSNQRRKNRNKENYY